MDRLCLTCGVALRKKPGPGRWPHWCSACRPAAYQRPKQDHACLGCGAIFVARASAKWCSPTCRDAAWRAANPTYWAEYHARTRRPRVVTCAACDRLVFVLGKSGPKRYCSPSCREYRRRERRRLRGGWLGTASRRAVWERDRWRCGLCRDSIDPTLAYPHDYSKSIDHIMPLSLGGSHDMTNLQAAHLICNVRKNNRVDHATSRTNGSDSTREGEGRKAARAA